MLLDSESQGLPVRIFNLDEADDIERGFAIFHASEKCFESRLTGEEFPILHWRSPVGPLEGLKEGLLNVISELHGTCFNAKSAVFFSDMRSHVPGRIVLIQSREREKSNAGPVNLADLNPLGPVLFRDRRHGVGSDNDAIRSDKHSNTCSYDGRCICEHKHERGGFSRIRFDPIPTPLMIGSIDMLRQ